MAAKLSKSQGEVWQKVAETQKDLGTSLDKPLYAAASPMSYHLTVEDEDSKNRKETFRAALTRILDGAPDAVGYAL